MRGTRFGAILVMPFVWVAILAAQQARACRGHGIVAAITVAAAERGGAPPVLLVETTVVSIKGEEKQRPSSCPRRRRTGAKTPIGAAPSDSKTAYLR
jgi:hypothetical protein